MRQRPHKPQGLRISNRGQWKHVPPFAHKLLKQVAEAIKQSTPDLMDPNYSLDYEKPIKLTVAEMRSIVELNEYLSPSSVTFTPFNLDGNPIEEYKP